MANTKTKIERAAKAKVRAAAMAVSPRGPNKRKLPRDFADWIVTQASKRKGLTRDAIRREAGQTCAWRPYVHEVAEAAGKNVVVKTTQTGRPIFFMH